MGAAGSLCCRCHSGGGDDRWSWDLARVGLGGTHGLGWMFLGEGEVLLGLVLRVLCFARTTRRSLLSRGRFAACWFGAMRMAVLGLRRWRWRWRIWESCAVMLGIRPHRWFLIAIHFGLSPWRKIDELLTAPRAGLRSESVDKGGELGNSLLRYLLRQSDGYWTHCCAFLSGQTAFHPRATSSGSSWGS